jgi:stage V sporulation protein SpoVS
LALNYRPTRIKKIFGVVEMKALVIGAGGVGRAIVNIAARRTFIRINGRQLTEPCPVLKKQLLA